MVRNRPSEIGRGGALRLGCVWASSLSDGVAFGVVGGNAVGVVVGCHGVLPLFGRVVPAVLDLFILGYDGSMCLRDDTSNIDTHVRVSAVGRGELSQRFDRHDVDAPCAERGDAHPRIALEGLAEQLA